MANSFSIRKRLLSFVNAFNGLKVILWKEHNFRIHLFAAFLVIVLGIYFEVERHEWLWLIASISIVFITETVNTAIERLVDLVQPNQDPRAGQIKDIAAGAVLIASVAALVIGAIIFWPYFCLESG